MQQQVGGKIDAVPALEVVMDNEVEKAELIQSVKALLIPLAFFLATIVTSAGGFLLYSGYALGYGFMAAGFIVLVLAFVAAFKFQNKLRARGKYKLVTDKPRPTPQSADTEPVAETAIH